MTTPKEQRTTRESGQASVIAVCPRCGSEFKLSALFGHLDKCPEKPSSISSGNNYTPTRKPVHAKPTPRPSKKTVLSSREKCPHCSASYELSMLPQHLESCPARRRPGPPTAQSEAPLRGLAAALAAVLVKHPSKTASDLASLLSRHYKVVITKRDVDAILRSHPASFAHEGDSPAFWYHLDDHNRYARTMPFTIEEWCEKLLLWPWQKRALEAWEARGCRGVIEAVTGTGKTRVGVAAAGWCAARKVKTLVLVPTADLQRQWCKEMASALPRFRVGTLGDGDREETSDCDILISTVQSAYLDARRTRLPNGLLIADECHRYGADMWSRALKEEARYRLGLTATYERLDNGVEEYLNPYFRGACYHLHYKEALADDIIANFKVAFLGVGFTPGEQMEYNRSDEIVRNCYGKLIYEYGLTETPFGTFMREVNELSKSEYAGPPTIVARQYLKAFTERRAVLAEADGKLRRLQALRDAIQAANGAIVFTQTTKATQEASRLLRAQGISAGSLYADLNRGQRVRVLNDFEDGDTDVIAAPKLLDEGIDVPAADLGIILAASRTRLQMVQRMGRVLRKKDDGRLARIVIMYVAGTSEDPNLGAHEAFLDLITPVASGKRFFSPTDADQEICGYLNDWRPRNSTSK